ncbi:MAG TPA: polyphenol oxidase family protein [Egibacteraceae bacterium]
MIPEAQVLPEDPDVVFAFSGRDRNLSLRVGDGDPLADRSAVLATVGVGLDDAVFAEQVHGGAVARVGVAERGRGARRAEDAIAGVDALVTTDPDVALAVLVADCVPVLLAAPGVGVGVAHAGRRGVAAGVVPAAVRALAGDDASDVVAVVGPAIGACCYEVDPDLAADFTAALPAAAATTAWGTPSLDLRAAVSAQLEAAGVTRISHVGGCTRCNPQRWHSHRADPTSGRQAGVIVRRSRRLDARPQPSPGVSRSTTPVPGSPPRRP